MANTNSYAENLRKLAENTTEILNIANGLNEAMIGNESEVNITDDISIPSFNNIVKRVERVENTISKFTQGRGVVEVEDGTFRKIKTSPISRPPEVIENLSFSNQFNIDPNWFFENLQYPRCIVKLDLTGKIDDSSDRVYVNRIIIDSSKPEYIDFYNGNILNQNLNYTSLIALLESNNIAYREDKDEVKLPLTYERHYGNFAILSTSLIRDSKNNVNRLWYTLDSLSYSYVNEDGVETSTGNLLTVGDQVRFNNSLYTIAEVNQAQNQVRLEYSIGFETLGAGDVLEYYEAPFSSKVINIGIGIDEIEIIYVKGINEEYNLVSKDWSEPITFISNELVFENNDQVNFENYYAANVADFGKSWIAQIKEGQIFAYNGHTPSVPVLNADNLQVVQINTQLDATLDKDSYNCLTTEIAQTKSNISAVRNTISSNKDLLIQSTSTDDRTNIQNLINSDTETLNSLTTQYNSLVEELNTLLTEAGAINYSPKYHIRGFFPIPGSSMGEQVIGFDVMYRYLHTDETGVKLNTYEYTDADNIIQTGIFTDWNVAESALLEKVYDSDADKFIWKNESTADGSKININQIDIPIRSGEKVEIKVRSISEAGYPSNPLKSDWSNSIIISFPDNLASNDNVTTILDTVKDDMTAVVLQQTMSAAGVYTHLSDGNSTYKHNSKNISYTDSATDSSGNTSLTEMSVQDKLDALTRMFDLRLSEVIDNYTARIAALENANVGLQTVISNLEKRIETTETNLSAESTTNRQQATSISTNSNIIQGIGQSVTELQARVTALENR